VQDGEIKEAYTFKVHWDKPSWIDEEGEEGLDPEEEEQMREEDEAIDLIADFHDYMDTLEDKLSEFLSWGRVEYDQKNNEILSHILAAYKLDIPIIMEAVKARMGVGVYTKEDIEDVIDNLYRQGEFLKELADNFQDKLDRM
jgi:dsDNA-binding SOS-regulon protein